MEQRTRRSRGHKVSSSVTVQAEHRACFVALPGGPGTLDEIFEALTWAQLGLHAKPCGLLNVHGYFRRLLGFLDDAVVARFIKPAHRAMLVVEQEPRVLLEKSARYS